MHRVICVRIRFCVTVLSGYCRLRTHEYYFDQTLVLACAYVPISSNELLFHIAILYCTNSSSPTESYSLLAVALDSFVAQ